jgi:hypothetical protein
MRFDVGEKERNRLLVFLEALAIHQALNCRDRAYTISL